MIVQIVEVLALLVFIVAILIFTIKQGIGIVKNIKNEKNISIKTLMYVMIILFIFPFLVYAVDRYNLASKLNLTSNLVSSESWINFMATYVATTLGVIFSSIILLLVTREQINKTFENERKKEEILKYQKEKSILKLYKGAIKEIRDSVNNFLTWLKSLKELDLNPIGGGRCNAYEVKYSNFANVYLYNIVEKDFEKSYGYIEADLLNTIVNMLEKSKEVLNAIIDDEADPMVNDRLQRMIKAETRKIIQEEVNKNSDTSIINILKQTESSIDERLENIDKEIEAFEKNK